MIGLMRYKWGGQKGFTLAEMVVVMAILGVVAAVATPLLVNFLGGAKERAYEADQGIIQTSVDAFYTDPANVRFMGKNQYPILGRGETDRTGRTVRCKVGTGSGCNLTGSFDHPDDGDPLTNNNVRDALTTPTKNPDWNPLGGIQGADLLKAGAAGATKIGWTDDGDAVREIGAAGSDTTKLSPDKWTTMEMTREATVYYVDARYYFVDMAKLVDGKFLKETPKSSAKDNSAAGTGSYIYYVDDKGKVQTLHKDFPRVNGFISGVYP